MSETDQTTRRVPDRAPTSTYRLQITEEFDLYAARDLLDYLHGLGVDWVYLSPLLASEPGSDHGYDVVSHDDIDPARGGAEGLAALSAEARRLGMGVLVDIVPNHVGVATPHQGAWWWDLLKHGRDSQRANAFDIDWAAGDGRIRIPVVGDDDQAESGGPIAHLALVDGELRYHDNRFPIAPGTDDPSLPGGAEPNAVHDRQHYELVNWRMADDELNYRRFFAVNELAGVRVEDRDVFEESHVEIRRWFDEKLIDGLRVDHPDGLRHPGGYLRDLAGLSGDAYVLVEKILEPGEQLLTDWDTAGTTGYDALGLIDRLLTDRAGQGPLDQLETRLRGAPVDWHQMIHDTKRAVADGILNSEVRRITREVEQVLETAEVTSPGTEEIVDAVAELLACFPVYRSYLPEGREYFDEALALALRHRADLRPVLDVLAPVLTDPQNRPALRFQQTSGMVMAKGVEDCAFYRWSRLTSLNEVGGDPSVFSVSPDAFHASMIERQTLWPLAMTALSTHDTKRGEDVRARITTIAELPAEWDATLTRLLELVAMPDAGFANLLWQAVVGSWPAGRERLHGYAEKAMREAGDRTTWTEPDEAYESAVHTAVDAAFDDVEVRRTIEEFVHRVTAPGWVNALSAKMLALTMPGVPDVYQGSELWEQSLVDPDNRRPVDFDVRKDVLAQVRGGVRPTMPTTPGDPGHAKLLVTKVALTLRRDCPGLFRGYDPLKARGPAAEHVVAFSRGDVISVVTRLPVGLAARGGWDDTVLPLPPGTWVEAVTGRTVTRDARLSDLLATYPVALLVREEDS
ncbi:malto-oligosyltrehalose synthase [Nocardioides pacificus]